MKFHFCFSSVDYKHGVSRCAFFDGFQIVAVSFIAEFSFPFCCFVFDMNQFKVKFKVKFPDHCAITKADSE